MNASTLQDRPPLTPKQSRILQFIVTYWGENCVAPSIREIGDEVGIASPNGVVCHVKALKRKGYLLDSSEEDAQAARNIRVPELVEAAKGVASMYLATMRENGVVS